MLNLHCNNNDERKKKTINKKKIGSQMDANLHCSKDAWIISPPCLLLGFGVQC